MRFWNEMSLRELATQAWKHQQQLEKQSFHFYIIEILHQRGSTRVGYESENCSVVSDPLWHHGLDSPGQNTGVGSLSLLQGIFPTQGSNQGLLHCRHIPYQLSQQGSPRVLEWVAFPFSRGSSRPRNWTRVSCIAGIFYTSWYRRVGYSKV